MARLTSSFYPVMVATLVLGTWAGIVVFRGTPYLGAELLGSGNVHEVERGGPPSVPGFALAIRS